MDARLLDEVLKRLEVAGLPGDVEVLVLAACEDRLGDVVDDLGAVERRVLAPGGVADPAGAYLGAITVQGFRGIGEQRRLDLVPGPGLTIVLGRNGSGKSSFAEAAELVLTGENRRWSLRPPAWSEAWRNLHAPHPARLSLTLVEEGRPLPTTLSRSWTQGEALGTATTTVRRSDHADEPLAALGWDDALVRYRPLLSYNELGSMLEGRPSELHDALASILGVEDLRAAIGRLRAQRLADEAGAKQAKKDLAPLLRQAGDIDDPRATRLVHLLSATRPDLDAADGLVLGAPEAEGPELATLRALAAVEVVTAEAVERAVERLLLAHESLSALAGSDAARARRVADLLDRALACVHHDGAQQCPVCGSGRLLDEAWAESTTAERDRLRTEGAAVDQAVEVLQQATTDARRLIRPVPAVLEDDVGSVPVAPLREAWTRWAGAPDDPGALAAHLLDLHGALAVAALDVTVAADAELDRRESRWRPLAERARVWLAEARVARASSERAGRVKQAEKWLAACAREIEEERFAPIEERMLALWEQLRLESSVRLADVALAGSSTHRRVTLDVTVDDSDANALGVMSQGELHALALAIFLPRATLPASPFRFVIIDDPVQSMDPSRIDGLARVLESVARDRQVIVFTHDPRLKEAVHRLQIPAQVVGVTRRPGSRVELHEESDASSRALADADAVARTADLAPEVATTVVAGLCREAIEATCTQQVRRVRLGRGETHESVADLVAAAPTTNQMMALALHGDAQAGSKVLPTLGQWGRELADVYQWCRKEAHGAGGSGDLVDRVRLARRLVDRLGGRR